MECPTARRVSMPSGTVLLSPREWALMEVFTVNPGVTLPRADLLTEVWGPAPHGPAAYRTDPHPQVGDSKPLGSEPRIGARYRHRHVG